MGWKNRPPPLKFHNGEHLKEQQLLCFLVNPSTFRPQIIIIYCIFRRPALMSFPSILSLFFPLPCYPISPSSPPRLSFNQLSAGGVHVPPSCPHLHSSAPLHPTPHNTPPSPDSIPVMPRFAALRTDHN